MGLVCRLAVILVGLQLVGWLGLIATPVVWAADPVATAGDHTHHSDQGHPGGESHGSSNPVSLDPDLAVVTAIIFLVLLAVLGKFAWKPIVAAIDKREHTMADQLAEAKRSQEAARQLLADHEKRLAGTALEVKQMLDQARHDAELQKQQILEAAQSAASAEKDRAIREINVAKNAALQDLANKSVETAVDLAGKIVRRQLSNEDHSQLIGDALQRFSSSN